MEIIINYELLEKLKVCSRNEFKKLFPDGLEFTLENMEKCAEAEFPTDLFFDQIEGIGRRFDHTRPYAESLRFFIDTLDHHITENHSNTYFAYGKCSWSIIDRTFYENYFPMQKELAILILKGLGYIYDLSD